MTYFLFILVTALLLGMRHSTDADHVLAISTIVTRERSLWRACAVGALWGAGHTLTILLVGGAIVVFRVTLPDRVTLAFEGFVAVLLMALGVRAMYGGRTWLHAHPRVPSFAIGVVHGLAGSAAAALLVVPVTRDPLLSLGYLGLFGLGTVIGMSVLTLAIAGSAVYATQRLRQLDRWIAVGAGAMSFSFGAIFLLGMA